MGKIVFFCIPAHGHTNPTLGVVKELVRRGHQVKYYSYEPFREMIENAGAEFVPCDEYDAEMKMTPEQSATIGSDLALSIKVLVDTTLYLDDMVCRDMEQLNPDCIVADSMAVWGKAIALKLGIPFVSSTTTFAFNKYAAKVMKQEVSGLFKMLFSMRSANRDLKRLRDKGYPFKNVFSILTNDESINTVVYTSKEFQPFADTFSDKFFFIGPSVRTPSEALEKTEKKLIYISMGTVNNLMIDFYKNCIQALRDTEYDVIISVGENIEIADLGEIPENITVQSRVDQIAVLQQADVFLSHCGMNSVNESLYYEVPLVLYPQTSEQGGVAKRVADLGAGIHLEKSNASSISETIEKVLNDEKYKEAARAIAESFRKCGGAVAAADIILNIAGLDNGER